jgi:ketosteroid isomerase-like protein
MLVNMRRCAPALVGVLAVLLFIGGPARGPVALAQGGAAGGDQDAATTRELTTIMLDMAKASIRGDVAFFDNVLADEVIYTTINGEIKNKAEVLDDYRKHTITFQSHVFDDIRVRLYGDMAVVTNRATAVSTYQGKPRRSVTRNTRTFVKRDGKWQVVAFQSTRIAAEQAPAPPSPQTKSP